jgi:multidrug resistance efflux pump
VVTAPFAGTLETPNGAPVVGTTVAPGRVLFRLIPLAPSERDARVDAERAAAESAARQEAAALRHRRAVELERDGAGSRRAVEEANADLKVADADLTAARDRLALADRGTGNGQGVALEAPHRALVRSVHASGGQVVAAAAPLVDLVRLDQVWVQVPLYVGELDDVDVDAAARVVGLGEPPEAQGVSASPVPESLSADSRTAGVALYYALDNAASALRPGQRVGVRLRRKGEAESLVVPRASLLYDAYGGTWVYEARESHVFVRRRVAVADLVGADALLERGPEPGTRVVTDGAAELFGTEFGAGK